MREPILVIMAAGMGSRYGGMKQVDGLGPSGEVLMDYAVYDCMKAGFKKVVFIIKEEMEDAFKKAVGSKIEKHMEVNYAFQKSNDIPEGLKVSHERVKPLGTSHAIYCARQYLDAPFAVINADDYYGADAFKKIYEFLTSIDEKGNDWCMISYMLKKTLTDFGHVSRGVCVANEDGYLTEVVENKRIEKKDGKVLSLQKDETWLELDEDSLVSMNMWGFTPTVIDYIEKGFLDFFAPLLIEDPLKGEYFIPEIVDHLINTNQATCKVIPTTSEWHGVTYARDKDLVMAALKKMTDEGTYVSPLWG